MTARRAFQNLAERGLIERHRRIGSRVRPAPLHRQDSILRPFTDEMRRRGLTPSSRLIRAELGASPLAAQQLGLPPTEWVVTIQRLRFADGTPVALETANLPNDFAGVLDEDLEQGFSPGHVRGPLRSSDRDPLEHPVPPGRADPGVQHRVRRAQHRSHARYGIE